MHSEYCANHNAKIGAIEKLLCYLLIFLETVAADVANVVHLRLLDDRDVLDFDFHTHIHMLVNAELGISQTHPFRAAVVKQLITRCIMTLFIDQ